MSADVPTRETESLCREWRQLGRSPDIATLDGFHAIKHAIRFNADIRVVICSNPRLVEELARSHAPDIAEKLRGLLTLVDKTLIRQLIGSVHATEVCALARKRHYTMRDLASTSAPTVLLENPRNLGNFGAVVRVAAGLNAAGVISTGDVDPWGTTVIRGSAGLHYAIPVVRAPNLAVVDRTLVAFDAGGIDATRHHIPDGSVLAFGSERHGISDDLRNRAHVVLAFPMRENVSSYNLATSVAMALYQWALQSAAGSITSSL